MTLICVVPCGYICFCLAVFSICERVRYRGIGYVFLCQAEDGIRDLVRSRGLGDVYKRQANLLENIPLTPADWCVFAVSKIA